MTLDASTEYATVELVAMPNGAASPSQSGEGEGTGQVETPPAREDAHASLFAGSSSSSSGGGGARGGSDRLKASVRPANLWRRLRATARGHLGALSDLRQPPVRFCIATQALAQFLALGMGDLFPLYASSPTGLRLSPQAIGISLSPVALTLFTWPFVFIRIERRFGPTATLRLGLLSLCIVNALFPLIRPLRGDEDEAPPPHLWAALLPIGVLRGIGGNSIFPSLSILLNGLITTNLGAMNGFATSMGSLVRGFAPLVCGSLFSATQGVAGAASSSSSSSSEVSRTFWRGSAFFMLSSVALGAMMLTSHFARGPDRSSRAK